MKSTPSFDKKKKNKNCVQVNVYNQQTNIILLLLLLFSAFDQTKIFYEETSKANRLFFVVVACKIVIGC